MSFENEKDTFWFYSLVDNGHTQLEFHKLQVLRQWYQIWRTDSFKQCALLKEH